MTWTSELLARESGQAILLLLTLDHPDLTTPIRVTSDGVDTVSGGNTFLSFPFRLVLPNQNENNRPVGSLEIDNVDRTIIKAIRGLTGAVQVTIQLVSSDDPNTVEVEFPDFEFQQIEYDAFVVRGNLSVENLFSEPFPGGTFDPGRFPGLF